MKRQQLKTTAGLVSLCVLAAASGTLMAASRGDSVTNAGSLLPVALQFEGSALLGFNFPSGPSETISFTGEATGVDVDISQYSTLQSENVAFGVEGAVRLDVSYVYDAILTDLEDGLSPTVSKDGFKYISLAHVYNRGGKYTQPEILDILRAGISRGLNSLSRERRMAEFTPVDELNLVYRFRLSDLGWSEEDWRSLMMENPYAGIPGNDVGLARDVASIRDELELSDSEQFLARGDWLVRVAQHPGRYEVLLDLPENQFELEASLGVDYPSALAQDEVIRAGYMADGAQVTIPGSASPSAHDSGVSEAARIIERVDIDDGYYWISYDFDPSASEGGGTVGTTAVPFQPLDRRLVMAYMESQDISFASDMLNMPMFSHDGGEMIFSLPNGLQGYWVTDSAGAPLISAPEKIVSFEANGLAIEKRLTLRPWEYENVRMFEDKLFDVSLSTIGFGAVCSACHGGSGIFVKSNDAVQPFFSSNVPLDLPDGQQPPSLLERELILQVYKTGDELREAVSDDVARYKSATEDAYRAIGLSERSAGWPLLMNPKGDDRWTLPGDNPVVALTADYANSLAHYSQIIRPKDDLSSMDRLRLELGLSPKALMLELGFDLEEDQRAILAAGFTADQLIEALDLTRRSEREEIIILASRVGANRKPSGELLEKIERLRKARIERVLAAEFWLTSDELSAYFGGSIRQPIALLKRSYAENRLHREFGRGFSLGEGSFECEFPSIAAAFGWTGTQVQGLYNVLNTRHSICKPNDALGAAVGAQVKSASSPRDGELALEINLLSWPSQRPLDPALAAPNTERSSLGPIGPIHNDYCEANVGQCLTFAIQPTQACELWIADLTHPFLAAYDERSTQAVIRPGNLSAPFVDEETEQRHQQIYSAFIAPPTFTSGPQLLSAGKPIAFPNPEVTYISIDPVLAPDGTLAPSRLAFMCFADGADAVGFSHQKLLDSVAARVDLESFTMGTEDVDADAPINSRSLTSRTLAVESVFKDLNASAIGGNVTVQIVTLPH